MFWFPGADLYLDGREVRLEVEILPNPTPIWCGSNFQNSVSAQSGRSRTTWRGVCINRSMQCFQKHCDKNWHTKLFFLPCLVHFCFIFQAKQANPSSYYYYSFYSLSLSLSSPAVPSGLPWLRGGVNLVDVCFPTTTTTHTHRFWLLVSQTQLRDCFFGIISGECIKIHAVWE